MSHDTSDNKAIAESIITLFKDNNVLKEDADYKKLHKEIVKFVDGLLG